MGKSLNMSVVAEGVETREQLEILQAHNCPQAQGFYFSRPVPAEEFSHLVEGGIRSREFVGIADESRST
jgi:EAL domain-containing protein (putative c-di-GMP-specific phosphodiesterase class I)